MTPNAVESKPPRAILQLSDRTLYAFPPNRETLGGTAYLLIRPGGNLLIDSPAWHGENQKFLQDVGVQRLLFTHRGNMGKKVAQIQQALSCDVVVQEQEAYLLPGMAVTTFQHELDLGEGNHVIWTSGHSPGSACLYSPIAGGLLFTGRHLLPDRQAQPYPLRTAKTFHWNRQIRSVQALLDRFTPDTLQHIYPGASLGFLRGASSISDAYAKLAQLDLQRLLSISPAM